METLALVPLALLALLLLAAARSDLRDRTIANEVNAAIALLAIPHWWLNSLSLWPDIALQVGVAGIVFGLFAIAFARGWMGGGDVKMIGALALWVPVRDVTMLLLVISVAGGVVTAAMLAKERLRPGGTPIEVPYGIAIAFGGLWLISERFLNQFG